MSLGYQRMKMRATTVVVDHMRSFCDGCNVVLNTVARPFRMVASRIQSEAPWVVAVGASTFITLVPLVSYPLIKKYVMPDERGAAEAERVRLCLQKGIDPYPYMRYKDYVYGNNAPVMATAEQMPKRAGWEYDALNEFLRRKEELRKEVNGNVDDTVQRLMELKKQQAAFYKSKRGHFVVEPPDLIFHGREDVDQVRS
ncbi:putative mitochondrial hypothetical protein [Leptomonas pyrrhocoris]|uniref:Uncharacterized protein n=1 Tax=Leptomonas pyrrhocoris TaxID=157538 RepID=A0A0M9G5D4_LEPPY|nr:putative mitochondrial hypothetical protein [Leptomonas pyrrhocoris]XP_015660928.1 putative mitochondrial hypothetical protein [Leptomonas pyrrhocoris]KPA82488.1 putative mitochondrial hypothetical protein [Leptomonas pyrrhocoris]KPA82489.1 putative mitochondrial hypothetical protein [Leptomonas pyrrhocoris]|eukprot:XP_015660927.1 putative mitochondrial hypothetical protein [Leptomonas pyrrhocoris]